MASPTANSDDALAIARRITSLGDQVKKYRQTRLSGPPGLVSKIASHFPAAWNVFMASTHVMPSMGGLSLSSPGLCIGLV